MRRKFILNVFSALVILGMAFSTFTPANVTAEVATPQAAVQVDDAVLAEMETNGSASYWVNFRSKVDLSKAEEMDWSARGWFVYEQLSKAAADSQAEVVKMLKTSKVSYQSYWIKNTILVESSGISVLNALQSYPQVESITARKTYILYEPDTSAALTDNGLFAIEPNIAHVNADDVWAMGFTGAGLVVANIDTGVRYSHEALVEQYRGNDGGVFDHNYNWFNPDDPTDNVPRDGNGHGTHTMGTIVGDDGGSNQIGMAPGAEWIACAGCPDGGCTDTALLGCGQWIAAPTDLNNANPDPDKRPNVVNNSWGDCGQIYDPWYETVIDGWHSAGIYPIFSNGNAGNCGYSSPPGLNTVGNPARSGNVTGVGSSGEQNGLYATHSNWGPTDDLDTVNPTGFPEMKPQVLAPGEGIRSSTPGSDTEYQDGWAGTSMSAPHVTGLIALMWQAAPCLLGDYALTENVIETTAVDMVYDDGSDDTLTNFPNYATGWGEIDAYAAVTEAIGLCAMGTLQGMVTDGVNPVEGAKVFAEISGGYSRATYTLADGTYSMNLTEGTYDVTASKYGYASSSASGLVITEGLTTTQDFTITPLATTLVSGYVRDGGYPGVGLHGYPLYARIDISGPDFGTTIFTDPFTGYYEVELLDSVTFDFSIEAVPPGYDPAVVYETFATGALPVNWTNYDYLGNGQVWRFDDPGGRYNQTPGGEGGFAILDSDYYGSGSSQDAGLRTPPLDFTGEASVVLDFDTYFNWYSSADSATVRVSADGGATWTPVWTQAADFTGHVSLDISAQAANQTNVIVEFKYVGSWGWYWQVDDVVITPIDCELDEGGVVAGYVYDGNTSDPLVGADVYSTEVATQTFALEDDPANEGLYWAFQPFTSGVASMGVQSLTGSNVVFDPTAGGSPDYMPGLPTTLCFESNTYSPDWEWVNYNWLKFPSDWAVSNVYVSGTPFCEYGGTFSTFAWYFESPPNEVYISHPRYQSSNPNEHCVAHYCVDVTPSASAGLVSWYFDGDGYAGLPHHPCSSDGYTPVSMSAYPCDEAVYPQASIPINYSESHNFTAEMTNYSPVTHAVLVDNYSVVRQDFTLGTGELTFDPTSFEVTMTMGDGPVTPTLTIGNIGTAEAYFVLNEIDKGYTPPAPLVDVERIPFTGGDSIQLSASGLGSSGVAAEPVSAFPNADVELILDDGSAENNIGIGGTLEFLWLNRFTPNPAAFPFTLNEIQVHFNSSGLVNVGDDITLVVYENTSGNTDPAVGANFLAQFPVTVQAVDAWNSYTLPTGVVLAGPGDVLIGVIGMEVPGTSYWPAALDQTTTQERSWAGWWLASPPPATPTLPPDASWTLIDAYFPGNWMIRGMGSLGGDDVVWLSETPVSGTIPSGGSQDVTLTIDPVSLTQPGDYLAHLLVTHDTPYMYPQIPVLLHLNPPATYGALNGTVYGLETCDINPMPLEGATVNFWQDGSLLYSTTTLVDGTYYYGMPAGTYDIEVIAAGYVSQVLSSVAVGAGETVTNDISLRYFAPCLSLDPNALEATQKTDQLTTQNLQVCNTGAAPLTWEMVEAENGLMVLKGPEKVLEPVVKEYALQYLPDGSIDCAYYANYSGFEPAEVAQTCGSPQAVVQAAVPAGPTDIGYAQDIGYISDNFVSFPLNNFTGQTVIGTNTNPYYGMDFDSSGTVLYALNDTTDQLGTIDLTTGAFTGLVACPPGGGVANWTGLSIDPTTDEFYGSTATDLYTIDPSTGSSTLVGSYGTSIMIAIAINMDGEMYGHDIGTDSIYSIDRYTGAATLIGLTGYAANYAQGMDFDNDDGTLYIFLYQGGGANVFGTVDLTTGAVNPLASNAPLGEFEGAIAIAGTPYDIPWVSEAPILGTLEGDSCADVTVTFDSTGLALGDYFGFLRVKNPPALPKEASLTLHVVANSAPVAQDQTVTTPEDTAKAITLAATDVNDDPLNIEVVAGPLHGSLSGTAPDLTYTPNADYNGPDSFTFKANDGTVDSNIATVSITVTPVNDPPEAQDKAVTTAEDTPKAITLAATDIDGDLLTFTVVAGPLHGNLSGTAPNLTYTPNADYNGADSFTFKANDGTADSNIATVSITVTPVNDKPSAQNQAIMTDQDVPVAIILVATDVDGDTLTFTVVAGPLHGTLSGTAPNLTYTPAPGFSGADSFTFKANDGTADSNLATVSITVNQTTQFIFLPILIR